MYLNYMSQSLLGLQINKISVNVGSRGKATTVKSPVLEMVWCLPYGDNPPAELRGSRSVLGSCSSPLGHS